MLVQISGCQGNDQKERIVQSDKDKTSDQLLAMSDVPGDAKEIKGTVKLNKADFIKKVWDYEKNPEKWVYNGEKPCLIDFYADWCAPCRRMAPVMEELAIKYKDQINIYKIDIQVEKELASVFGIQSIPSFLIVPMNENPQMHTGMGSKEMFAEIIEEYMLKKKEL